MLWLRYVLRRGPRGLGIEVDGHNVLVEILPDGPAAIDGLARVGDIITAVDGVSLAGRRMVDEMVPGRQQYEVTIYRSDGQQLEAQAVSSPLGRGTSDQPLSLLLAVVRRGPGGLGLDIGEHSCVHGLVRGSLAEKDGVVRPGDTIAGVDGRLVGLGNLPDLVRPGLASYAFLLLRPMSNTPFPATSSPALWAQSSAADTFAELEPSVTTSALLERVSGYTHKCSGVAHSSATQDAQHVVAAHDVSLLVQANAAASEVNAAARRIKGGALAEPARASSILLAETSFASHRLAQHRCRHCHP